MNVILVDASYTTFHRFFATYRWMSFAHKEHFKKYKDDNKYDWSKDELFMKTYEKQYLESIKKVVKSKIKGKDFKDSIVIFCQDSPQAELWRHEYIDCYKGKRADQSEKVNLKPTFSYTYNKIIPNLVKENKNIYSLMIPKIEGDDVIAIISKYIRRKKPNYTQFVVSGDQDFLQLGYPNLYFADYKKKELLNLTRQQAKDALLQKIISGDCSDNIPSIFVEKISNKEKKELKENKDKLKIYINSNKKVKKQFQTNKKIISFKYIPKEYQKIVLHKINFLK